MRKRIEKFFMLGVIPFVFTILLILVLLSFMGVDVGGELVEVGRHIPFVGKYLPGGADEKLYKQKIESLTEELEEQKEMTKSLMQELERERKNVEELKAEQLEEMEKQQLEAEEQFLASYRRVAKSLENMSARKAAPIVTKMPTQEALMTLYAMKTDTQSEILSKMPPDYAAAYTSMLKELLQFKEQMTLPQATEEVVNKYEEQFGDSKVNRKPPDGVMMFASMPPAEAAAILEKMPETDALAVLGKLDASTRASILSQFDKDKAGTIAQRLTQDE